MAAPTLRRSSTGPPLRSPRSQYAFDCEQMDRRLRDYSRFQEAYKDIYEQLAVKQEQLDADLLQLRERRAHLDTRERAVRQAEAAVIEQRRLLDFDRVQSARDARRGSVVATAAAPSSPSQRRCSEPPSPNFIFSHPGGYVIQQHQHLYDTLLSGLRKQHQDVCDELLSSLRENNRLLQQQNDNLEAWRHHELGKLQAQVRDLQSDYHERIQNQKDKLQGWRRKLKRWAEKVAAPTGSAEGLLLRAPPSPTISHPGNSTSSSLGSPLPPSHGSSERHLTLAAELHRARTSDETED